MPYIFIAPEDPSAIGEIAQRVYRQALQAPEPARARRPRPVAGRRVATYYPEDVFDCFGDAIACIVQH